ncbi:MAG: single-stranded DNA-binding protein [Candidatus Berkelbacteria bacterium]|nr:single-stranded DNA-binding protein [Candidatus Berkelbacteria bacterium]
MISLNKVMLVGNLTRDPELRYTPSGKSVCSFGMATNRRWKGASGEMEEAVEFHDIVVWGKLAEIISQILKKGNKAYVDGRLQTRSWEGQDGIKRQKTEVVMENFIPLYSKGGMTKTETEIAEIPSETLAPEITEKKEKEKEPAKEKTKSDKKAKKESDEEEIDLDDIPF